MFSMHTCYLIVLHPVTFQVLAHHILETCIRSVYGVCGSSFIKSFAWLYILFMHMLQRRRSFFFAAVGLNPPF